VDNEASTLNITNSIVNGLGRLDLGRNQANGTAALAATVVQCIRMVNLMRIPREVIMVEIIFRLRAIVV